MRDFHQLWQDWEEFVRENAGGRSFWGQGGDACEILMKKKPKQGRRPELSLCNVAEGGADYASGAFGAQGDSPPARGTSCVQE